MAAGPGGVQVGRVTVRLAPDSSKFGEDARKDLKKETKNLEVEIPIRGDVDKAQIRAAIESIRVPELLVPIRVSRTQARAAIDAALLNNKPSKAVEVPVKFDRPQIKAALASALTAITGGAVSVPVSFSRAQVRTALKTTLDGLTAAAVPVPVKFDRTQVRQALTAAIAGGTGGTVAVDAKFSRQQIRAAWQAASANLGLSVPVDVHFRPQALRSAAVQARKALADAIGAVPVTVGVNGRASRQQVQQAVTKGGSIPGPDIEPRLNLGRFNDEIARSNKFLLRSVAVTAQGMGQAMQGLFQDLPTALSSGFGNIGRFFVSFSNVLDAVNDKSKDLKGSLAQMASSAVGLTFAIGGLVLRLGSVLSLVSVVGAGITAAFGAAATAIAAVPAAIGFFGAAAGTVALGLDGIKKAAKTLQPEFDALKSKVSATFEKGLTPVFRDLKGAIKSLTPDVVEVANSLVRLADGVQNYITTGGGLEKIRRIFQLTAKSIDDTQPGMVALIDGFLTLASNEQAFKAGADFVNQLGTGLQNVVNELRDTGDLDEAFFDLRDVLKEIADLFNGSLKAGILIFKGGAGEGLANFLRGMKDLGGKIDWERIGKAVGDVFTGLGQIARGIKPETVEKITQAFERMGALFKDPSFQNAIQKIIDALPAFIDFATQLIEWAGKIAGAIAGMFSAIGGQNAAGIAAVAGIGLLVGKIVSKLKGLFSSLTGLGKLFKWSDAIPEIDADKDIRTKGGKKKKMGDLLEKGKGGGFDLPEIDVDKDVKTKNGKKKKFSDLLEKGKGGGLDIPDIDIDRDVKTKNGKKKKGKDLVDFTDLGTELLDAFNSIGPGKWIDIATQLVGPVTSLLGKGLEKLLGLNEIEVDIDVDQIAEDLETRLNGIPWSNYGDELAKPLNDALNRKAPGVGNDGEDGTGGNGPAAPTTTFDAKKLDEWRAKWDEVLNAIEERLSIFTSKSIGSNFVVAMDSLVKTATDKLALWRDVWNAAFNAVELRFLNFHSITLGANHPVALDSLATTTTEKLKLWTDAWALAFDAIELRFLNFHTITLGTNYPLALDGLVATTTEKLTLWSDAWGVAIDAITSRLNDFFVNVLGVVYPTALNNMVLVTQNSLLLLYNTWLLSFQQIEFALLSAMSRIQVYYQTALNAMQVSTVVSLALILQTWVTHLQLIDMATQLYLQQIIVRWQNFFLQLSTMFMTIWPQILNNAVLGLQNMVSAFGQLLLKGVEDWQLWYDGTTDILGAFVSWLPGFIGLVVDVFSNGVENWRTTLLDGFDRIFTDMGNTILRGLAKIDQIFSGGAEVVGDNTTTSLSNSILNGESKVINAVVTLAASVINNALSMFGIGSPSKVFRGIGANIIDGWRIGLEQEGPAVLSAVDSLSTSIIDSAAGAGASIGTAFADGVSSQGDAISAAAKQMVADAEKYANQAASAIEGATSSVSIDAPKSEWAATMRASSSSTPDTGQAGNAPVVGQMTINTDRGASADDIVESALFRMRHYRRGLYG